MKYLIDTDYAISYLKGKRKAGDLLLKHKGKLAMSVISYGEVLEGIYGQEDWEKRISDLKSFLTGVTLIEVNKRVSEEFAVVRSRLRKKKELLENLDILIAATAKTYKLTLITGNRDHFERIEGLKITS